MPSSIRVPKSLSLVLALLALSLGVPPVAAQETSTDYVKLDEAGEIALARSAAPDEVSAGATVWVLRDGGYQIAVEGTNGNHCFVARSMPRSLEPVCYDAEGAATVLRWEFEYLRLRISGASDGEREAALTHGVETGRIPTPRRPAMSYMMSSAQRLFDPESGRAAGNWRPHLMLYIPNITEEMIGLPAPTGFLQVARPGTPMAHVVIVVPDFVEPNRTAGSGGG